LEGLRFGGKEIRSERGDEFPVRRVVEVVKVEAFVEFVDLDVVQGPFPVVSMPNKSAYGRRKVIYRVHRIERLL